MVDRIGTERRSENMRRIRSRDTKPELAVRRALFARGYRFRLQRRDLPGRPDIVMPGRLLAIFVHGCFWHRHAGCGNCTTPSTRTEFWQAKFNTNVTRDARVALELGALGWNVQIIWECTTKDPERLACRLSEILKEGVGV